MGKMISAFGFAPYVLTDGVREMISEGDRKLRPVMSRGQVIAPLAFFAKALGAEIAEKTARRFSLSADER